MITQAEYAEASKYLGKLCKTTEAQIAAKLVGAADSKAAIKITQTLANSYHAYYEDLLFTTLAKTGTSAAKHYTSVLSTRIPEDRIAEIVAEQFLKQGSDKYYGATLGQRLKSSRLLNSRRIQKSAYVGASLETRLTNLSRILQSPYPFGAQINLDRRILLGQMVKLEQDIALGLAEEAGVKVVKWTLSHKHTKKDICDTFAEQVTPKVVRWLRKEKIKLDPKGLYFVKDAPHPPHPNCRCHLQMLDGKKLAGGLIRRTLRRFQEVLGNLG